MKKVKTIFLFILIVAGFLLAACQAMRSGVQAKRHHRPL
ncbi:colicin release lysis protein [Klebsiella pneumoniae]|nr:colicin release lysis protein [Klebsiella pneumoniae]